MTAKKNTEFKVVKCRDRTVLAIDSERIDVCMKHYLSHNIDEIWISRFHGYKLKDIKFLQDYPLVKGIIIDSAWGVDISGIENLRNLKFISISFNEQPIDFSIFESLEDVSVEWHPGMKITEKCKKLKHLYFRKYNSKSKTLIELPYLENLEFLGIVQSPLRSLEGVGKYKKLKELQLAYLTKLETLCDMETLSLDILDIDVCRNIQNHEYTGNIKSLNILRLNDCGVMPSIDFIREMPNLKDFRFVGTDVLDGDMTPCLALESTGFTSKRHFSHSNEKINQLLKISND